MTESRSEPPSEDVVVTRRFGAPVERVYAAFTDPAQLARWYGPQGVTVPPESVTVEARPGGTWAVTMRSGSGWEMASVGTVVEVLENRLLVITETAPDGSLVTLTIEFFEDGDGTRLELRQGPFPSGGAGGAAGGWGQALDKLETLLTAR